jgi:alcohol dehydrogenase class IV
MNIETFFNNDKSQRFYFPGKIFIGSDVISQALSLLKNFKFAAIVIDQVFAQSSLMDDIKEIFSKKRYEIWIIDGAPFYQDAREFMSRFKGVPDVVVSIGGGSASDFAKSIILNELFGTLHGVGVGEMLGAKPFENASRPTYIAIPTTAGSGAEASRYYVLYDKENHQKVYGKTWQVVADWIFLDPKFLENIPTPILISCAFDAFIHFFESMVTKYEKSMFSEMFSVYGIKNIIEAIDAIVFKNELDNKNYEKLIFSATLAGIAISNVRTGNIHEAAGALLEQSTLNHGETLYVFFRVAVEQYKVEITPLVSQIFVTLPKSRYDSINSVDALINWWEAVFIKVGLHKKISEQIVSMEPNYLKIREFIFNRVFSDRVWVDKESPIKLTDKLVYQLVDDSFQRFQAYSEFTK